MKVQFWTEERHEALVKLAAEGLSASQIGAAIGCTRNSVIGRCGRTGVRLRMMNGGGRPRGPANKVNPPKLNKPKPMPKFYSVEPLPETEIGPAMMIPFDDLNRSHCRYPCTDDHPFLFCGQPRHGESSYCGFHHQICWRVPEKRVRKYGRRI